MAANFSILLPIIGGLLVVAGAFWVKRGRWPQRVGDTPHCRKCDYILSGDQSRCPECGTTVQASNVIRGERHRRAGLTALGGGLALFGLALILLFAAGATSTINWNRHKPLSWLLNDMGSSNPSHWAPAWTEVQRRLDAKLLSEDDQNAIVEKGLQLQAAGTVLSSSSNVLDFIAGRYLDHKLTPAQSDRFFAGALKVKLLVRPVVGALSPVPYSIAGVGHGPGGWWVRMRTLESQIDDGPVQKLGGGTGSSGFGGWTTGSTLPPAGKPGKHRLHVKIEMATDASGGASGVNWDDNAVVAKRLTQDLFADFQAIDGQTPITTVAEPSASALRPLLTTRLTLNTTNSPFLDVGVDAASLPVDVAFDVFVRVNGKEYPAGGVSFYKNAHGSYGSGTRDFPADAPSNVDVIFRSSEAVAAAALDMTQIWKGEIVLQNVPLRRTPAMPHAPAPAGTQPGPAAGAPQ